MTSTDKEKALQRAKKHYEDNKQAKLAYAKKYREENKQKVKESKQRSTNKKHDFYKQKSKSRYYSHQEEVKEYRAKFKKDRPFNKRASDIFARCNNSHCPRYIDYGGRGVQVKFDSVIDLENYLNSLPGFEPDYEIDRIDNDGHYEVGNLRWTSRLVNSNNKRIFRTDNTSKIPNYYMVKGKHVVEFVYNKERYLYRSNDFKVAITWLHDTQIQVKGSTHINLTEYF